MEEGAKIIQGDKSTKVTKGVKANKRRAIKLSDKTWKKARLAALKADITVSEYIERVVSEKEK